MDVVLNNGVRFNLLQHHIISNDAISLCDVMKGVLSG